MLSVHRRALDLQGNLQLRVRDKAGLRNDVKIRTFRSFTFSSFLSRVFVQKCDCCGEGSP